MKGLCWGCLSVRCEYMLIMLAPLTEEPGFSVEFEGQISLFENVLEQSVDSVFLSAEGLQSWTFK